MKAAIALSAGVQILFVGASFAQIETSREAAIAAFAEDIALLQEQFPVTESQYMALQSGMLEGFWEGLIEQANDIKDRWANNPYVEVTGFSISVGLRPGIDVQFTFK